MNKAQNTPENKKNPDNTVDSVYLRQAEVSEQNSEPVFYYDRTKRLERMPKSKKLYEGGYMPKRGFFAVLTGTKTNRFLLMALGFLVVLVAFFSLQGTRTNKTVLDGIPIELDAFVFDSSVYVTVTLAVSDAVDGEREISVRAGLFDEEKQLIESSDFTEIYAGEKKQCRAIFNAKNAAQAVAIVTHGEKTKILSIPVDRE